MKRLFVVALFATCIALPRKRRVTRSSHATGNPGRRLEAE